MSARTSFAVAEPIRAIIRNCQIEGNAVRITQQLDRETYQQVNKVLDAAGGKWNRKAKAHVFERDPAVMLKPVLEGGNATHLKNLRQAFFTPKELAEQVVDIADVNKDHMILEPEAGQGALADALVKAGADPTKMLCIEIDEHDAGILVEKGHETLAMDFLDASAKGLGLFDRIVMNPPFTKGQDIEHITHAISFLKPGGRLVSITSTSWPGGSQKAHNAFRDLIAGMNWETFEVPPGAFQEAGTGIPTLILVLNKPSSET